jgi:hypothetical protein
MDKSNQLFTQDSVDDDIDLLINNRFFTFSDPDAQLVYELRHIYKEDADSIKRVWNRLEQYSRQHTSQELLPQIHQRQKVGIHTVPFRRSSSNTKYPANRLFTVLAAAIVGLFLVSSLAWVMAITPATPAAPKKVPALTMATSGSLSDFVKLTIHNDKSNETNYFTITYKGDNGKINEHVVCQAIPPLSWINVESSPDVPAKIPTGQTILLRYYHSAKCNPSSMFMSVNLPIPVEPTYNQCWFNPDNTTTPNWSGCVRYSQIIPIDWY